MLRLRGRRVVFLFAFLFGCGCGTSSGQDLSQDSGTIDDDTGDQDSGASSESGDAGGGPTTMVRLVVEPDDKATTVTDAIRNAKTSVHLEQYLLTDSTAESALIAAKAAGKEVKVVLEKAPYPDTTANNAAYAKLQAGGVNVVWTNGKFALTHSKFFVLDGTEAWIGTLNFSASGLSGNREYVAVDTDPADVSEAEAIFGADFAGAGTTPPGPLVVSPTTSRTSLRALLDGATATIDVEMEEISDTEMVQRLGNAAAKGIVVRVVVPGSGRSTDMNTSITTMVGRGVQVKGLSSPDVHAKIIVVDDVKMYLGSVNLTSASIDRNREVGVLTANGDALTRAKATIDKDFAAGTAP
jgi:phosphatidylserine/phosphatidylglycerophosphate/cardiolipin synthase-like enzyme